MIESLQYITTSRPDILFSVYLRTHFQYDHKESNLMIVKRTFKISLGTTELTLWYPRDTWVTVMLILLEVEWTEEALLELVNFWEMLRSWNNKKQSYVILLTDEAEYIFDGSCVAQILWLKHHLKDFGISFYKTSIFSDNKSAIDLTKN